MPRHEGDGASVLIRSRRKASVVSAAVARRRLLDLQQELRVGLRLLHAVQEELDGLLLVERVEHPAQLPDHGQLVGAEQDLFLTGAGRVDVHRREDALVRELPVELELHVAGALELLEDHLVHARAGLDERGGQDGQRAAVLDVARGTEEALRRVERGRVDTTGQDAAGGRRRQVVGTAQTGDRVQQDHHVVTELHEALRPLDGELRDRGVVLGGTVEGRGDDLALHRPLHVGDLFRTLVDQDDHQVALGAVDRDRVGDGLQDHGLTGLRRGHNQASLALADRCDQVDDPGGQDVGVGLQTEPVLRVQRGQLLELGPAAAGLRRHAVDRVEADQRVELLAALAVLGLAHGTRDVVALAQTVLADLGERDVHVVRARQVAGGPDERVVVEDVEDARDGDQDVVVGHLDVGREVVTAPTATAVAVAAATATPAALVVETVVLLAAAALLALVLAAALLALTASAALLALVVALAPAVALAVPAVAAVTTVLAVTAAAVLTVAPTALGVVRGGLGLRVGLRLAALVRAVLAAFALGLGLRLGRGLRLGVRAARLRGRPTTAALAGRLVVTGRLARDVDLLLRGGLVGGGRGSGFVTGARLGRGTPLGLARGVRTGGRGGLGGGRGGSSGLRLLDDLDQLALAHPRSPPDAEAGRDLLQLGQDHALEAGAGAAAPCGGARGSTFGGHGAVDVLVGSHAHQIGGVAHEGSFPGADVGLLARRPVVLSDCGLLIVSIADLAGAMVRRVRRRDESAGFRREIPLLGPLLDEQEGVVPVPERARKLRQAAQAVGEAPGRVVVPEGDTKQRATKTSIADLRLTLPAPTNIPPLMHRQSPGITRRAATRSRRRFTSSTLCGIAGPRYSWWIRSSVAASSSSGRLVRASTSRAARPALAAASTWGTVRGSRPRAVSVSTGVAGTKTTGTTEPAGSIRMALAAPPSVQARVKPPRRQAATLSGCPSISVASSSSAASSRRASPPVVTARAATMPAQMAADEEPRPRPCGMRLAQTISRPWGCPPSRSKAVRRERTSRWFSSRGSVSAPSPAMSMCSPESATRTTTSS